MRTLISEARDGFTVENLQIYIALYLMFLTSFNEDLDSSDVEPKRSKCITCLDE